MTVIQPRVAAPPVAGRAPAILRRPGAPTVIVVGAGLGGLGTAVRLQSQGYQVTILEKHAVPGGRCGFLEDAGFRFDTGPTLLLMVEYLRALFTDAGRKLEDYLELVQLDPNYRITWSDGSTMEITSRLNAMLANVETIEPGSSRQLLKFLAETNHLYTVGLNGFVDKQVHTRKEFFNLKNAALLIRGRAMQNLRKMVGSFFKDERLRGAFSFQSLYLGLSPYKSPAIYSLLPYTEVAGGLYFPMGGMHALPRALARLAGDLGVTSRYGAAVTSVERSGDRVTGVRLEDGTRLDADLVVINADLPYAYETLLGEKYPRIDKFDFSCSAFLMYMGTDRLYPELRHHNLVVPSDLRTTCDDIFERLKIPAEPAYYICNPSKTDPSLAPAGGENLFVLVPVPAQEPGHEIDWAVEGPKLEAAMMLRLEKFGLTDLRRHLVTRHTFTPEDFRRNFGNTRAEAFGLSHGIDQVGYFRPQNRHPAYANLYFVGQSTHPGCGVPMVLISARLTAERLSNEHPVKR